LESAFDVVAWNDFPGDLMHGIKVLSEASGKEGGKHLFRRRRRLFQELFQLARFRRLDVGVLVVALLGPFFAPPHVTRKDKPAASEGEGVREARIWLADRHKREKNDPARQTVTMFSVVVVREKMCLLLKVVSQLEQM